MREETEAAEAVVDCHNHKAALREARTVIHALGAVARGEPAAVEPDHDRRSASDGARRRPDVEGEGILTHRRVGASAIIPDRTLLRTVVAILGSGADTLPGRSRLRCPPAIIANRRNRIWDALEGHYPIDREALQFTGGDLHGRGRECGGGDGVGGPRNVFLIGATRSCQQSSDNQTAGDLAHYFLRPFIERVIQRPTHLQMSLSMWIINLAEGTPPRGLYPIDRLAVAGFSRSIAISSHTQSIDTDWRQLGLMTCLRNFRPS